MSQEMVLSFRQMAEASRYFLSPGFHRPVGKRFGQYGLLALSKIDPPG